MTVLLPFVVLLLAYGLVSGRLEKTSLTPPIVFTAAGFALGLAVPALRDRQGDPAVVLPIAEIGLVFLLFTDASRTDLDVLRRIRSLPARLLSTGMLLTLVLGAAAALLVFPGLSLWEAGILSAILAPTDAGLGQIVVSSEKVPMRIRQALNVEAGLNDGLSVPFLLFFLALARTVAGGSPEHLTRFVVEQLGYGAAIGVGVGLAGGWALGWASRRGWLLSSFRQIAVVTLPLLCALASEPAGASMFIAAFVGGLAVQVGFAGAGRESVEFTEQWGQVFNLFVFFLFGVLVARRGGDLTGRAVAYAVLSLTLVRMLPVAVALLGTRLSRATVLFMGWFGPRGLASIVLALVFMESGAPLSGERTILTAVVATVLISIFAHGLSARRGIDAYAASLGALGAAAPEREGAGVEAVPPSGAKR
ncbi:MAG TPA: cation:proton antiporter [Thermoanaerobaculia bacterium]|nr:cation:proton antiporter [Thermoanaerobaculia bacterium]